MLFRSISKHIAERKGYADAMMLDWQGRVAECTGANIFFINNGKIHTPIADWRFTPGKITQALMDDYTAEVQPKGKKAAA